MVEYNKIESIYKRDPISKKTIEEFRNPYFNYLKNITWDFTEKVDGTNIRVCWDGHSVMFLGRTNKAQIPNNLLNLLNKLFGGNVNEELFEQKFGNSEVIIFGEGYGPKINCGERYTDEINFIVFDVMINGKYLSRTSVVDISNYFNLPYVPILFSGNLQQGIDFVKSNPKSIVGNKETYMEGLVARPQNELYDSNGNRLITKIKYDDIKDLL